MIADILLEKVLNLDGTSPLTNMEKVFIKPNIPPKKLEKAIASFGGSEVKMDDVLILLDDTLFGSAKDGVILTKDTIFLKPNMQKKNHVILSNINTIEVKGLINSSLVINGTNIPAFTQISKSALIEFSKFILECMEELKQRAED